MRVRKINEVLGDVCEWSGGVDAVGDVVAGGRRSDHYSAIVANVKPRVDTLGV